MHPETRKITDIIVKAAAKARRETKNEPGHPHAQKVVRWPLNCTIGPGLEGAIACESKVGYVNGAKGWLVYRGYDIFDLCAYSTYEEVSYLLLHGSLPTAQELEEYKQKLIQYRYLNKTLRILMGFPVEEMNSMAALRMGTLLMRQEFTDRDKESGRPAIDDAISADEDSIPMETLPTGEEHAIYEFSSKKRAKKRKMSGEKASGLEACYHLIAGVPTITAAIARVRQGNMAIEPDPELSHAANLLYMMNGTRPTPLQERIMDIALILHADHGMNASTFASMVVASTLSDIYFSVGSGIAALSGPLHGGANEQVLHTLKEIGSPEKVKAWVRSASRESRKIPGFGHRVYKAYDPRARVLGPMAAYRIKKFNDDNLRLFTVAQELEKQVHDEFGKEKKIFPNVDFYSGIVYSRMGIDPAMFTPLFAVSRVAGWTARVLEYLQKNRIFRPRAMYTGDFEQEYVPLEQR
ncbi:MAG: citrate/2-methylcitrate synthase [Deltaproteobacteria bacterium]|nr:citrate/2-methylcitrate synthase [Candidatus Anaeroferrophillus wilburensis]MBN2888958.1 citrate/2-methylcitrate synthase [Deltaproteobacteria bacterium]